MAPVVGRTVVSRVSKVLAVMVVEAELNKAPTRRSVNVLPAMLMRRPAAEAVSPVTTTP